MKAQIMSLSNVEINKHLLPFAELLERWPDDSPCTNDAIATNSNIGKISTDDCLRLDDVFAIQNDVLRTTKN